MSIEVYALTCVILSAVIKIISRHIMLQGVSRPAVILYCNIAAAAVLLPTISLSSISEITAGTWLMIITATTFWLLCGNLHMEALKYMGAAESSIFGTLNIVIITLVGVIAFNDVLSNAAVVGILIIVGSMLLNVDFSRISCNKGTTLAVAATISGVVALSIDKVVLTRIDVTLIAFFGYFFPSIMMTLMHSKEIKNIKKTLEVAGISLLLLPALCVLRCFAMLNAYSLGQISSVTMILQTTVAFIFVLELLVLKEKARLFQRGVASAGCVAGAICVAIF